jgi:hypothetical protein
VDFFEVVFFWDLYSSGWRRNSSFIKRPINNKADMPDVIAQKTSVFIISGIVANIEDFSLEKDKN